MGSLPTTQTEILTLMGEGRVTPHYAREEIDAIESKQNAHYHLKQLRALGRVEKVHRGLYELAEDESRTNAADAE